jgi:hypothetical protein
VDFILPRVDLNTRTVRARLVFPNPGLLLKPGMFVNVVFAAPTGKKLTIPASSIDLLPVGRLRIRRSKKPPLKEQCKDFVRS